MVERLHSRPRFAGAPSAGFRVVTLSEMTTNTIEPPTPLPIAVAWIGARFKFEVREKDGNKCLVKAIDNKFFQTGHRFSHGRS